MESSLIRVGNQVLIFTTTFYAAGTIANIDTQPEGRFILLKSARWVASTGSFSSALTGHFWEEEDLKECDYTVEVSSNSIVMVLPYRETNLDFNGKPLNMRHNIGDRK